MSRTCKITIALTAFILGASTLAGCSFMTSTQVAAPSHEPATVEPTPAPATQAPPSPALAPACKWPAGNIEARTGELLDVKMFAFMTDTGARDGADGTAVLNADGTLAAYKSAKGDDFDTIAQRFCTVHYGLEALNAVRRGGTYSSDSSSSPLVFEGDTLNLDPYTISSVGDQNRKVFSYHPSFRLPPQH